MNNIKVISSPRPENDNIPLPTYHEILNYICDEFKIPGSPSLWDAVNYIKRKYVNKAECEIGYDGDKRWWLNNQLHREDGPAVERSNGDVFWYIHGKQLDPLVEVNNSLLKSMFPDLINSMVIHVTHQE